MTDHVHDAWNFRALLGQGVLKTVGDQLSSEKLVLPFLYTSLGGPILIAGLLMPVVIVSKMVAELFSASVVEGAPVGKWYLAIATIVGAAALALVSAVSGALTPLWLAVVFLAVAFVLGLCNGFSSLTFQDMLGRVLSEERRSGLLFLEVAAAGVFTMVFAGASALTSHEHAALEAHIGLVWIGIAMFVLAAVATIVIREVPKPRRQPTETTRKGGSARYLHELSGGFAMISRLAWFRRYLIAVVLFLSIELVFPFVAIHAAYFHKDTAISLSMFVVSSAVGMVLAGFIWPRVSRISVKFMMSAAALVGAVGLSIALVIHFMPSLRFPATHALIFGLLAISVQGVSNGRLLYLVNAATDAQRPYCVAVASLIAGTLGLAMAFAVGAIAHERGIIVGLSILAGLSAAAAVYAPTLPDVRLSEVADEQPNEPTARTGDQPVASRG